MTLGVRILGYLAAWLLSGIYVTRCLIEQSRLDLASDPSAMAWTGFLPFVFPLILLETAAYVLPVVICIELGLGIWRWIQKAR